MELSLDIEHRTDAIEFVNKQRQEYDRLLDEAPDIPHNTICEFNKTFPEKDNKPDVCNGLNVIEQSSDTGSEDKVRNAITRWLKKTRRNKSFELSRGESV
jgi:hypothetical protein